MANCSVDGCTGAHYGGGLCSKHYQRQWKGKPPATKTQYEKTALERLMEKVTPDPETGCWNWNNPRKRDGRANLFLFEGKSVFGYCASYQIHKGPQNGLDVCHTCDNPRCCNPDHLWLGTHAENMADMLAKGRGNKPFGARNGMTKMTDDIVRSARAVYAKGDASIQNLALLYGVDRKTLRQAILRQTWRHVE